MRLSSYTGVLEAFKNLKVLIIGDAMIDTYSFGEITRISPEAPVPVVRINQTENRLGGAANVALNIQSLGAVPILCSVIGKDRAGDQLLNLLKANDLSFTGIVQSPDRQTTVKNRVVSKGNQLMRLDHEDDHDLSVQEADELIQVFENHLPEADVVIIQDYEKGVLFPDNIERILVKCGEYQIPVCVDPKKKNFGCYKQVDLLKPNLKELLEYTGETAVHWQEAALLVQKSQCVQLLLTLSGDGIYYLSDGVSGHSTSKKREVADVSGAGDTVIAVASLCIAIGLGLDKIALLANTAGGIVCESQGVVPISYEKLLKEASQLTF